MTANMYLKIAISMLIRRIFATKRKIVIRTGGIQPPGTQLIPENEINHEVLATNIEQN